MNVLQIMKQARYDIDALRTGGAVSGMWQDEEVLKGCNVSMDRAARLLRLSHSNLLTTSFKSTDGTLVQLHEDYQTSNMRITSGVTDYTLPSDFIRVETIRPITTGFEGTKFHPTDLNNKMYMSQQSINVDELPSANNSDQEFWYTILGDRTIRIAPTPKDTIDLELVYHYRPAPLLYYNTGTIQRTNGLTTVVGGGTTWIDSGLRAPADLIVGLSNITTGIDINLTYPTVRINKITSNTVLDLARAATVTDGVGQAYYLAMVPILPEEHHNWLAQMVAATLLRKVDADLSAKLQADLGQQLLEAVLPEVTLRQLQESIITEAFELPS